MLEAISTAHSTDVTTVVPEAVSAPIRGVRHQIEEVGARLRAMMPWLSQKTLVNTAKN